MNNILAFVSIKGGVGKTTLALETASALANKLDKRVLLVDANFSAPNIGLYLDLTNKITLHDCLNGTLLHNAIYEAYGIDIIPADLNFNDKYDPYKLSKILNKYKKLIGIKKDSNALSIRKIEIQTKLSQYLLTNQGDRMSMANSVEQRFPYMDTDVVNYALNADKNILMQNNVGKDILRKTFQSVLPKELTMRKKQGYLSPDIDVACELIKHQECKKYLSEQSIEKLKIFNYLEVSNLIKRIASLEVKESDARFLLFVYTTQLLEDIFHLN